MSRWNSHTCWNRYSRHHLYVHGSSWHLFQTWYPRLGQIDRLSNLQKCFRGLDARWLGWQSSHAQTSWEVPCYSATISSQFHPLRHLGNESYWGDSIHMIELLQHGPWRYSLALADQVATVWELNLLQHSRFAINCLHWNKHQSNYQVSQITKLAVALVGFS